jgi:hypothetical protein
MFSALNQLCTATAPGSEKHCTMMAKTTPYPPCTGTVIWLACRRVPGQLPDAASGNAYYHNRRAVMVNSLNSCTLDKISLKYPKLINIVKLTFLEITAQFEAQMNLEFETELLETNYSVYSFGSGFSAYKIKGITIMIIYDGRDNLIFSKRSMHHEKYPNCSWIEIYSGDPDDFFQNGVNILKDELKNKN